MNKYELFLKFFGINLLCACIGPLFMFAPIIGLIPILIYSLAMIYLKKDTFIKNILMSLFVISIMLLLMPSIILVGIIFQVIGILLAVILGCSFLTKIKEI